MDNVKAGLEGVVVAETRLSDVDGARGRLIVAGEDIEKLAGQVSFEALAARLLGVGVQELTQAIGRGRLEGWERLPTLGAAVTQRDAMVSLRAALAQLPTETSAASAIGAIATFVAAHARVRSGQAPIAPDPSAAHAADLLRMVRGSPPSAAAARALDCYLVTVADHGMNASTFSARVVASTGSDLVSSLVAAVGALKGPLHGGAPGPVLDMLDAIATPAQAERWLRAELDGGRRIMGMGHRIYRVRDPRAAVFERALERLRGEEPSIAADRLALAQTVEATAERLLAERHPDRPLKANVEFYTALLLEAVGLDRALFTAIFAVGRAAGWCAHVAEQRQTGRLIRPASTYVGAMPG